MKENFYKAANKMGYLIKIITQNPKPSFDKSARHTKSITRKLDNAINLLDENPDYKDYVTSFLNMPYHEVKQKIKTIRKSYNTHKQHKPKIRYYARVGDQLFGPYLMKEIAFATATGESKHNQQQSRLIKPHSNELQADTKSEMACFDQRERARQRYHEKKKDPEWAAKLKKQQQQYRETRKKKIAMEKNNGKTS